MAAGSMAAGSMAAGSMATESMAAGSMIVDFGEKSVSLFGKSVVFHMHVHLIERNGNAV